MSDEQHKRIAELLTRNTELVEANRALRAQLERAREALRRLVAAVTNSPGAVETADALNNAQAVLADSATTTAAEAVQAVGTRLLREQERSFDRTTELIGELVKTLRELYSRPWAVVSVSTRDGFKQPEEWLRERFAAVDIAFQAAAAKIGGSNG